MKYLKKFNENKHPEKFNEDMDDLLAEVEDILDWHSYYDEPLSVEEALDKLGELSTDKAIELYAKIETLQNEILEDDHESLKDGMYKSSSEVITKSLDKQFDTSKKFFNKEIGADEFIKIVMEETGLTREEIKQRMQQVLDELNEI